MTLNLGYSHLLSLLHLLCISASAWIIYYEFVQIYFCFPMFPYALIHTPRSAASERLDISPSSLRVFKLLFALSSAMHIAACFFWRVKVGLLPALAFSLLFSS